MEIILNNPYRKLGLLAGATAREQDRQIRRLKRFIEAEQNSEEEYSFSIFGRLNRTLESVDEAASKLNLDRDKMSAALFWFYMGNPITDEPAFDALKEADLDQVITIWKKLVSSGEVSQRNASAYSNLGTLYLSGVLEGTNTNQALLEQGISLKLKYLESDFIKELKSLVTDETFNLTKKELQLLFLHQLQTEIEKDGSITLYKFFNITVEHSFSAKEDFIKEFVQRPIEQIEKKVEETKTKRKANKANAVKAGRELYNSVVSDLMQLRNILGKENVKFASLSDKVSDEILQCGIDYFSYYKNTNTDSSTSVMSVFKLAKILAVGKIVKQRCQENTESLQEYINHKFERDKQAKISVDYEKLENLLAEYEEKVKTVANGRQLLASARPHLNNIKNILGGTDVLYLVLSSGVASDVQGMCVSEINNLQDKLSDAGDKAMKINTVLLLKERVNEAWDVITTIGSMDLHQDFRTRYSQNRTSLSNLKTQLSALNTEKKTGVGGGGLGSSSSGCYIATMAYGDYDHPQVMILRQFRDEVLDKSALGKWFIKTYYHYSPKLVERLKNQRIVNIIIRKALNQFIKLIKK